MYPSSSSRRRSCLVRLGVALTATVGLVAGCGGGDSVETAGGEGDGATATDTTYPDQAFFEAIYGNQESSERKQLEVEDMVRDCMTALGWEYTPVDYSGQFQGAPTSGLINTLSPDEVAEDWGYLLSTAIGHETELYGDFSGGPASEFVDPNQEYVQALSTSDQEAYYKDLYGDFSDFDPESEEPPTPQGCQGIASAEVFGDFELQEELGTAVQELETRIAADSRIVDAQKNWRECMADKGFPDFQSREDIYNELSTRLSEVMGWNEGGDGFATETIIADGFSDSFSDDGGGDGVTVATVAAPAPGGFETPEPKDPEGLARLQERELELARADLLDCGKDLDETTRDIRAEYQEQFLIDHPELVLANQ